MNDSIKKHREAVKALYSRATNDHGFDWCLDEMYRRGKKATESENQQLKKIIEFFGIEILDGGGFRFKPSTIKRFKKSQVAIEEHKQAEATETSDTEVVRCGRCGNFGERQDMWLNEKYTYLCNTCDTGQTYISTLL